MTELELIEGIKGRRGQKLLYEQYYPAMARLCVRYLKHELDAFEVLSSGFIKIFKKADQFQYSGEGSLNAWIAKVMVNECLMELRKRKRLPKYLSIENVTMDEEHFTWPHDAEYLYAAIRELPDGCRTVFNLHVIEGYSHKEIADQLKITESASRSQLTYAKKKLRELLSPYFKQTSNGK